MSLELAIQENTSAIRDLIARLTNSPDTIHMSAAAYVKAIDTVVKSPDLDAAVAKIEATAKVENPKPAATPAAVTAATVPAAVAAASPSEVVLDYTKDVKPLLVKVSLNKGRDTLVALLAKFGVVKGDALPADKLGNVIAEVELLLAA